MAGAADATAELEAELIKRNREIAKARDATLKAELRLEDATLRNDELLEKLADLDAELTRRTTAAKELEERVRELEGQLQAAHAVADASKEAAGGSCELRSERDRLSSELDALRSQYAELESASVASRDALQAKEARLGSLERDLAAALARADEAQRAAEAATSATPIAGEQVERLERQCAEAEAATLKARQDFDERIAAASRRITLLEKEISRSQEKAMEVEGRMDSQREYVESVNQALANIRAERDHLIETKGALEAQLRTREESFAKQEQACQDSVRRCRELEERLAKDREGLKEALECTSRSSVERLAAVEAELRTKQQRCDTLEQSLAAAREEADVKAAALAADVRRAEQELAAACSRQQTDADVVRRELVACREEAEALRGRVSQLEAARRTLEVQLSEQALVAEDARREREEDRAALERQLAVAMAGSRGLEETLAKQSADLARAAAEREAALQTEASKKAIQQMWERAAMAQEEAATRQVDAALDRQRLTGALEESRRALRSSLGLVAPAAAIASSADGAARAARAEAQVTELRRRLEDKSAELERSRRRVAELERDEALAGDRHGQEVLLEAARRAQLEAEERSKLAAQEVLSIRAEADLENAKLRGALDQLRYMLKLQSMPPGGSGGGYPAQTVGTA